METFNILKLKVFCGAMIWTHSLPLPVRIELMDFGMNIFFEMTATSKVDGTDFIYIFSNERSVGDGGVQPMPWRVRLISAHPAKTCVRNLMPHMLG